MLGNELINAIHNERGIADILKLRSKQEVQDVLVNHMHEVNERIGPSTWKMRYTLLTYAINEHNDQAIKDILQIAEENGVLKQVLELKTNNEQTTYLLRRSSGLPFYYAISEKNSPAIKSIFAKLHGNDIGKLILSDTARRLYSDIEGGRTDGSKYDQWAYLFNKHSDVANSILRADMFRYKFTKKELDKLTQEVDKGNYKKVINTIRKRQLHLQCAVGVAMVATSAIIAAGIIWSVTTFDLLSPSLSGLAQLGAQFAGLGVGVGIMFLALGGMMICDSLCRLNEVKISENNKGGLPPKTEMDRVDIQSQKEKAPSVS